MGEVTINPDKVLYDGKSFRRRETLSFIEWLNNTHKKFNEEEKMQDFKIKINRRDIVEIVDNARQLRIEDIDFIRTATVDDVHGAYILLSLQDFLRSRRCDPDFEVVLSE